MALRIDNDYNRFKQIIRGKIKQNLKKYMSSGEMIGKQGKEFVSIPLPRIDLPRFIHDPEQRGGVGQGEGDQGSPVGPGQQGQEKGQGGNQPGQHVLEVDVSLEELAEILGEELELPNIEPKGEKQNIDSYKDVYTGINRTGPESLRHFKRTYKEAIKRQIVTGSYNPKDPMVVPIRDDKRYRTFKRIPKPTTNAVIFYLMDVSGSMGTQQKSIVRTESFWIDTWLTRQYQGIDTRYIIHDATAREVDKETFFKTRESGGTIISSAYKLTQAIIEAEYDVNAWNIYVFHFSDGDNWSSEDSNLCLQLLRTDFLPNINLFGYGQVESQYGSGQFFKDLESGLEAENLILSRIDKKEDIYDSIKLFLGKGK